VRTARRARTVALVHSLPLLLGVVACSGPDQGADPGAQGAGVPVRTVTIARTTLHPTLDLVGAIVAVPERTAVVSPQLGGWIRELKVVEGQSVRAGDTLVELDARSAEAGVERARAAVEQRAAALERLQRGYLPEEIAGARSDAEGAAALAAGRRSEVEALRGLLDRGEISGVLFENKAKALAAAEAALASARERVKLLEAGTRPEVLAEGRGALAAASADLAQARLALEWCTITSPIDGLVVQLLARKGQYLDRAASLATLIDLSEVFARFRIPGEAFARVHRGTKVEVELESLPGTVFAGAVDRIAGRADTLTGHLTADARVQNDTGLLRPGLRARVHVWLPPVRDVLAAPVAAIADRAGVPVVTVVRDGRAYETEVQLGLEAGDLVQVVGGLAAEEVVATSGGYGLPDGTGVAVGEGDEPGARSVADRPGAAPPP